ncbi:signal transduction histidine kinase [Oleiphilus messinensis]|uniref:histidine kinase n=1 Tax=Oleiphilus messinensis TaxID=141451 RepID=A0A1Y0I7B7_9GAMM|nr:HAMP domain-containing sensor histidine kinase [Oleiphilus messinensis]ARU56089.1 signal transduction histidine kinase [Oleiphilus messinensis]
MSNIGSFLGQLWQKLVYRRSAPLTQQWTIATAVTVLPLLAAVIYAVYSLERQNQSQYVLVTSVILANQSGLEITEDIREMERLGRQYVVLRDNRFIDLYQEKYTTMAARLQDLKRVLGDELSVEAVDALLAVLNIKPFTEAMFASEMSSGGGTATGSSPGSGITNRSTTSDSSAAQSGNSSITDQQSILKRLQFVFDQANGLGENLKKQVASHINHSLKSNEQEFSRKKRHMLLIGSLILPGTAILLLFFSYHISRPLKDLAGAIRLLGQGKLNQEVSITGPSDLVALGVRLEWMRNRLLYLEKQKNVFLRHVTHELKTPLASIMEATSLLEDEVPGPVNDQQQHVLGILDRNARKLLEQIQQLLNFNAVREQTKDEWVDVSIAEIVHQQVNGLEDSAGSRQISFQVDGQNLTVQVDVMRFDMVLSNLLSNAVNYSPRGGVVQVVWGLQDHYWWLSVSDQGTGIAESEMESIFQPFYQGAATRDGAIKGSGLGLSIVKECIQALNGHVKVENKTGGGAVFTVTLPLIDEDMVNEPDF